MQDESKDQKLTKEGLLVLQNELEKRKTETRQEIADELDGARQQGDLSENAAYHAALERNELNEIRISKLKSIIKNADLIKKVGKRKIGMGNQVKVRDFISKKIKVFQLVSPEEVDPQQGRISVQSPLGLALKEKKKGDKVTLQLPSGDLIYTILSIS